MRCGGSLIVFAVVSMSHPIITLDVVHVTSHCYIFLETRVPVERLYCYRQMGKILYEVDLQHIHRTKDIIGTVDVLQEAL